VNNPPPIRGQAHASAGARALAAALPDGRGRPEVIACWSAKGSAGTTVVAAALALRLAQRSPAGAVLVDGAGDAPAVLGLPEPHDPGLAGWLRSDGDDPLAEVAACPGLSIVPRGVGPLVADRADQLAAALASDTRPVVVDCGNAPEGVTAVMAERADQSLLVTRPCYLALRRFVSLPLPRPTGVVVIREPGRALSGADVAAAVGAPIVTEIDVDAAVARTVDAGLLAGRLPRSLDTSIATVLDASRSPERVARPGDAGVANDARLEPPEVSAW
jgi:MinD superfamily P-loop ATPase